jgi:site-specific DNA-adenine methylase
MWGYTGSKWQASKTGKYPAPIHNTIIEPFAGSAGYSLFYGAERRVILCEINPDIVAIWCMIQKNRRLEARLPKTVRKGEVVEEMRGIDDEVRLFLHYKTCAAHAGYHLRFTERGALQWPQDRRRMLAMAGLVKSWEIVQCSFEEFDPPRGSATWFVDPPYEAVGIARKGSDYKYWRLDYSKLRECVKKKWRGQVIVAEQVESTWLPFKPLYDLPAQHRDGAKSTTEAIWYRANNLMTPNSKNKLPPTPGTSYNDGINGERKK